MDDITATVRHWAPVLMRHRAGLPERVALDPMETAVTIRAVDPAALEPRHIPLGHNPNGSEHAYDALAMDGRLWTRLDRIDDESNLLPASIGDGLGILSGAFGSDVTPFRPRIPEALTLASHPGDVPIPARAMERAGERFHEASAARVRDRARHDLAHDGVSILIALDHPLIAGTSKTTRLKGSWRPLSSTWRAMFRLDRVEEAARFHADSGHTAAEVAAYRSSKATLAAGLAEGMRGIKQQDDDLRQFVNQAPLSLAVWLGKLAKSDLAHAGAFSETMRLCAKASIDAMGHDLKPAIETIERMAKHVVQHTRNGGSRTADMLVLASTVERYARTYALPLLEGGPVHEADADALADLAP